MSVLRINVERARDIAHRAYKAGHRALDEGEDALRDFIDLDTAGDLDCVEMDIAVDLVRGALLRINNSAIA